MKQKVWTVARFPAGSWSAGGAPDIEDYKECEVYLIPARTGEEATKKAQSARSRLVRSGKPLPQQLTPYTAPFKS